MSLEEPNSNFTTMSGFTDPYYPSAESSVQVNLTDNYVPLSDLNKLLWTAAFFCIWLPAIVLNTLVIGIIVADKTMRKVTNAPLADNALSELCTSVMNTYINFYRMLNNDWTWPEWWCTWNEFLSHLFIARSVFTLMAISIDRYQVLARRFAIPRSNRVVPYIMACFVILLLSIIVSSPVLFRFDSFPVSPDSPRHRCMWDNYYPIEYTAFNVFFMVTTYFIPLTVMGYCYMRVCQELRGEIIGEGNEPQRRMHEQRKKMIKMLIVVVTCFAACWLPTHIFYIVVSLNPEIKKSPYAQNVYLLFYWLAMANNMINPWIYFKRLPKFDRSNDGDDHCDIHGGR